jgi:prepilin peptidase CpaA
MVLKGLLITVIIIAGYHDLKWRRIPNWLILFGLVTGFVLQGVSGGFPALADALQGWLLGMALLMIPFILRGMGAGDVKLLGVVGALQGWVFVVNTFLWMAVWGGIMAFIALVASGKIQILVLQLAASYYPPWQVKVAVLKSKTSVEKVTIPYGVAIGMGVISSMIWVWW